MALNTKPNHKYFSTHFEIFQEACSTYDRWYREHGWNQMGAVDMFSGSMGSGLLVFM